MLDRLQDAELKLGPMNADELRSTIEGPAARAGLTIGQPLVDHLLADARDEPGRLPLLEFALKELWLRRERFELTETAYHDLGWLRGAIAKRADAAYDNLCEDEQKVLPQLFRQLVRVGEKSDEDTRRTGRGR